MTTTDQDSNGPLTGKVCVMCDEPLRGHSSRKYCSCQCSGRASKASINFGLNPSEYRALIDQAAGRCPICLKRMHVTPHIDHDHKTLKITGAVCSRCNVGALALTYHDVGYVRRLLNYLEHPPAAMIGLDKPIPKTGVRPSSHRTRWGT